MITYIKGTYTEKKPTSVVLETVSGVAYHINVSLHTFTKIQTDKTGKLFTHFHVKEDAQTLYGFAEDSERILFRYLISVSGIGPTTAQVMLSSLNPAEIQDAIVNGKVDVLKACKGIGAKTAQRVILELKDKLAKLGLANPSLPIATDTNHKEEALNALLALGIAKSGAQRAINRAMRNTPTINSVEQLIKLALKEM
ncbi:MAG: Holliday junction branch migration protein RuvA [Chitinophagales bacterium]